MPNSFHSQLKFFNHFIQKKNFWIILATDIAIMVLASLPGLVFRSRFFPAVQHCAAPVNHH